MKIIFVDEYGENIIDYAGDYIPVVGDTISIDDEDWRVRSRTFSPQIDIIVVELTQSQIKQKSPPDEVGDRLKEMQRVILGVSNRQDLQEKRTKSLREQAMSIRQHIRRNTPKPKETT